MSVSKSLGVKSHHNTLVVMTLFLAALMLFAPPAFAQGCSQCRTAAEATGSDGGKAINLAIFVLLIPTLCFFVGVLVFALRRRHPEVDLPVPPLDGVPRTETVLHVSWLENPR